MKKKREKEKGEKKGQIHRYQGAEEKKRGLPVCLKKGIGNWVSSALLCSILKEDE